MRVIDFSDSFLYDWGTGVLNSKVKSLTIDGNFCQCIRDGFFPSNNSLTTLRMRNNLLGSQFGDDVNGTTFQHLGRVRELDISLNVVYQLQRKFFIGLKSLRNLTLSDNKLQEFNFSLSHMDKLEFINASSNSISWIYKHTRDDLDHLSSNKTIKLDLQNNPLPCSCAGREVLHWLATTNVHLIGKDLLYCRFDNNLVVKIGDLNARIDDLNIMCGPPIILISAIAGGSGLLVLVVCLLLYRLRWNIRYILRVRLSKWFGFKPKQKASVFKFDAFIIYAEADSEFVLTTMLDELETKRGHKLCVEDRDFLCGTFDLMNITCAIQSSTFTLPVISPNFIKGVYSEYGIQMALCEESFEKRQCLHPLLYEPVNPKLLPKEMWVVLNDNRYTEFPPLDQMNDETTRNNFWDDISRMIGHTGNMTADPRLDLNGDQ